MEKLSGSYMKKNIINQLANYANLRNQQNSKETQQTTGYSVNTLQHCPKVPKTLKRLG